MKNAKYHRFAVVLALLSLTVFLCAEPAAAQQQQQKGLLFTAPGQSCIYASAKKLFTSKTELQMNVKISAKASGSFLLKPNYPLGTGFETIGVCNGSGVDLLASLSQKQLLGDGYMNGIDDAGNLKEGYYVQISALDLDGDGVKEALVFLGDNLTELRAYVFRFTGGSEPFKFAGAIDGQRNMSFEKGSLISPVGTQGLFDEYKYSKGKLTQIKN